MALSIMNIVSPERDEVAFAEWIDNRPLTVEDTFAVGDHVTLVRLNNRGDARDGFSYTPAVVISTDEAARRMTVVYVANSGEWNEMTCVYSFPLSYFECRFTVAPIDAMYTRWIKAAHKKATANESAIA